MITLIAARARGNVIGKDGDMPWHLPEDLKYFMRETMGGAMIMGRNTWNSLPNAPLKNRLNIVVTSAMRSRALRSVCGRSARACDHAWLSPDLWRGRRRDIYCDVTIGRSAVPD